MDMDESFTITRTLNGWIVKETKWCHSDKDGEVLCSFTSVVADGAGLAEDISAVAFKIADLQ